MSDRDLLIVAEQTVPTKFIQLDLTQIGWFHQTILLRPALVFRAGYEWRDGHFHSSPLERAANRQRLLAELAKARAAGGTYTEIFYSPFPEDVTYRAADIESTLATHFPSAEVELNELYVQADAWLRDRAQVIVGSVER